jgi:two-component system, NarL family, captular synthesis response regulator RcsB
MYVSGKRIKVAIVDAQPLAVCGLRRALEASGFDVVGAMTSPAEMTGLLERSACDVIVTDYSTPDGGALSGWRFLSSLAHTHPDLPILVYSDIEDPFVIGSLVRRDVDGIVSKREDMEEVIGAIRKLAQGSHYRSPIVEAALDRFDAEPRLRRFASLTRWQMEITGLMLCGMSVMETARLLGRGRSTISKRRLMACKQLGFARESDLYRFVSYLGLSLDGTATARASAIFAGQ